jgi:hypothetical protein
MKTCTERNPERQFKRKIRTKTKSKTSAEAKTTIDAATRAATDFGFAASTFAADGTCGAGF